MKSFLTTSFVLCLCGPFASAALVANYDFQQYAAGQYGEDASAGAGNTNPRVFAPSTSLTLPTGIDSISNLTITVTGTDLNVTDNNNSSIRFRHRSDGSPWNYSFSVTVAAGYQLKDFSLSSIQHGNTNGGTITYSYNPNGTGSVSMGTGVMNNQDDPTLGTPSDPSDTIATAVTGTIDFLMVLDPTSTASRNYRVDDFQLNGTVSPIPEPSSAMLLMGALLGGVCLHRRR